MLKRKTHSVVNAWIFHLALLVFLVPQFAHAAQISSFPAGDGGWHLGTLAVGNLDADPDLEIVVPYRNSSGQWILDAFKYSGQRLPGFPYNAGSDEMNVSPTLVDLDGDGRDEILITRANHVIALRGDGSVLWSNTISSANYVPNGGYQTITNGFYWSNGGGFINHLPGTAVFSSQVSSPIVADIKGNGTRQVITGWKIDPDPVSGFQDYNPFISEIFGSGEWGTMGETWSGGVAVLDALTGKQQFIYHIHQLVESGLAVGHADTNPASEIYVLNDSDSVVCFDMTKPHGLWGKGMLHKQFGKNQRLMSGSYQMADDIYVADIDGDGLDEVLVAGTQMGTGWQPNETILDDDGAVLWRQWRPPLSYTHNWGWRNNSCLVPVNPDHDNHIDVLGFTQGFEITYRYWNGIELVDHPGWPKSFYPYLPTPPVVGDVDGDGQEEIIIGTYNPANNPSDGNLLIYALDGTLKISLPVPGGLKHLPTLADVNHDGSLDVVYRSLLGQVYVQNFGANSTNMVSWATHRGNAARDGNRGRSLFPPGTPKILSKQSGYCRTSFAWSPMPNALAYRVERALGPSAPYLPLVTLVTNSCGYTDSGLQPGVQYFYEIGAVYSTGTVYSPPFAILSSVNSNLVANSGFEENDNSHWDKWFSGDLAYTNMLASTNVVFQGRQSMEIRLVNETNSGTLAQWCQYGIPDSSLRASSNQLYSFGGWIKSGGLSRPSEHWFEWASAKDGYDTNNRPALPWPNYFTPHFVVGSSPTEWMYLNRTFIMPAGFPNIDLRHKLSAAAPASGSVFIDNVFFRALPGLTDSNWLSLVPFGDTWRYFTNTPASDWVSQTFDDSRWPLGLGKFGAGSGPQGIVTRLPQNKPAYYFRKKFNVPSTPLQELLLSATCTDDYGGTLCPLRLWLNGTPIVSSGIETVTGQGNEIRYFDLLPFAGLLFPGTNTIAVQVSNLVQPTWDDVAFDVSLKAIPVATAANSLSIAAGNPITLRAQTPAGTIWQVEAADTLAGPWNSVAIFTNLSGGKIDLQDTASSPKKFYRFSPY